MGDKESPCSTLWDTTAAEGENTHTVATVDADPARCAPAAGRVGLGS
jgi:hypothetical protein